MHTTVSEQPNKSKRARLGIRSKMGMLLKCTDRYRWLDEKPITNIQSDHEQVEILVEGVME